MVDKIPVCLHTCFHCAHAAIVEEYVFPSSPAKLLFDGCWRKNRVRTPLPREECKDFKENGERIKRKFWRKWEGRVCTCFGKYLEEDVDFEDKNELSAQQEDEKAKIEAVDEVSNLKAADEILEQGNTEYEDKNKEPKAKKENRYPSTSRVLILKALTAGVHHLGEIAVYAGVDPSTAHYHLRNLIKERRILKLSWGEYVLPEQVQNDGRNFENLLQNLSQVVPGVRSSVIFHPAEKNILMDILSKENKYEKYSERELARKCKVSRYAVKKYTRELEKKRLIEIKRKGNRLVFVPTKVAIEKVLTFSVEGIQKTQTLLHENQLQFSQDLVSHVEMVQKISEAAESLKVCADILKEGMSFYVRATSSPEKA